MGKGLPKRWENYSPVGCRVPGTRFLPFKVPLNPAVFEARPSYDPFTPGQLVETMPDLKAVIDLTDTSRYYKPEEFTSRGIVHVKINIVGGGTLPNQNKCKKFFDAVDQLSRTLDYDSDALIGVHCTHGLNRTGYLICKYMVLRMKIDPQEAINRFEYARGYNMERQLYIADIMTRSRHLRPAPEPTNWRQSSSASNGPVHRRHANVRFARSHENWGK